MQSGLCLVASYTIFGEVDKTQHHNIYSTNRGQLNKNQFSINISNKNGDISPIRIDKNLSLSTQLKTEIGYGK